MCNTMCCTNMCVNKNIKKCAVQIFIIRRFFVNILQKQIARSKDRLSKTLKYF